VRCTCSIGACMHDVELITGQDDAGDPRLFIQEKVKNTATVIDHGLLTVARLW
jgi:hypothetical protein